MFINNKYKKWYDNIVARGKTRILEDFYYEKHHIIPKSLGGSNRKDNIVHLTAKEHYIVHLLLTKFVENKHKYKMICAMQKLMFSENPHQTRYVINARMFQILKIRISKQKSIWMRENNPFRDKKHSEETKILMQQKRKNQDPPMLGKKHSEETKEKLREANRRQFENPNQIESRKQKLKKHFEDPVHRYNAGNGKRGKSWFHNPENNHTILCFPNEKPNNYIKGRKMKGGGSDE